MPKSLYLIINTFTRGIMNKKIVSILLISIFLSLAPGVLAEGKVAVVANTIDIEMNPNLISLLKENNLTVEYFGDKDIGYNEYDVIIILGGPDSKEPTGELSKGILTDSEQNNLRKRKYKLMYETSNYFKMDQIIFILAGSDRDFTKAAVEQYAPQIISKVTNVSSDTNVNKNLTASQLKQLIDSGEPILIIDVRTGGEFNEGHITGAINIPYDKLGIKSSQIPKDKKVVLYCDTGARAVSGAVLLAQKGFQNIYTLKEGYSVYKNLG